jgi:zinc protease
MRILGMLNKTILLALVLLNAPCFAKADTNPPASTKPQPSRINVEEIKSSNGISAWVVETHEIPVVSVSLAFKKAGTVADPNGYYGLAQFLADILDEGSGESDSQAFKKFLLKNNIELSIKADSDAFLITFRTVKKNVGEAFYMLKNILTKPRFDESAISRVKNQLQAMLEQALHNEHTLGSQELNSILYGNHPYGRKLQQIIQELPRITAHELRQFMKERFARDQLLIAVVGDICKEELKEYLDKTFAELPAKAAPLDIQSPTLPTKGSTTIVPLNIPQSLVRFAQPNIPRKDRDWYAAFVLTKILGDGEYESRLWDEIREKRGLAYEIEASISWSEYASLIIGGTATKNTNVKEVIQIIKKVWTDMIEGATQSELDFVKRRLIGNFALKLSSTLKIAKALLAYQIDDLGIDYINKRNEIIAAITLEDINRVAKRILHPDQLTFVICGEPTSLSKQGITQENKSGVSNP